MNDTIAAIATAYGEGGIGIIRISGEKALPILQDIFECAGEADDIVSRRLTYGRVIDQEQNQLIDEVMAVYMKAPKTYTAEDVVEIDCHGSIVSLRKILELVLRKGARLAEPGEFTKRAFLNGRIDLSQAEAVMDIVKAKTDKSFDVAVSQLEGSLSLKIREIRKDLLDLLVDITVNIDYPDEDIEEVTYERFEDDMVMIRSQIEKLLQTATSGRMLREGIRVAIVGKPNVGKSSLMNGLLHEARAIVTEIPGTTRDTIEEAVSIRDIPVYLVDTAGIRETEDKVEKIGIEKTKEAFNSADLVILILDSSEDLTDEDRQIMEYLDERHALVLLNKQDLGSVQDMQKLQAALPKAQIIETSLLTGEGLEAVEDAIEQMVYQGDITQQNSVIISNVRHVDLLRRGQQSLDDALAMTGRREALDFIEVDVNSAYEALGEIIGETVNDDILNEVFSRFCLGK